MYTINAYSCFSGKFICNITNLEAKKNIALDRKVLSELAMENPAVFTKFIESVR
jgi:ribosomal protein L20